MSQGRPTNPPKGTHRPVEPSRPEAGTAPGGPTGSPAGSSNPSPAEAAKPGDTKPGDTKTGASAAAGGRPTTSGSGGGQSGGPKSGGPGAGGPGAGGPSAGGPSAGGSNTGGSGSGGRTPPPPSPAAPASRGGGWVAGVVGGVVGAALAVFGAPLVQGPPPLGPEAQSRIAEIERDSSAIAERVAALQSLADDLEPAVRAAVEEAIVEVPSRDGAAIAAVAAEVEALTATTGALETRLTETAEELAAARDEAVSGLDERLTATTGALDTRLTETAEELAAARDEAVSGLDERLTAAAARLDTMESEVERQLGEAGAEVGEMLREAREAASAEVGAVQAAVGGELEALRGQLTAAEAELAAVQGEVLAFKQARSRAAAAALLVRDIDRSIDNGAPFAEPLGYLMPMAADDATLTTTLEGLLPYAESGVPTMQALRDDLLALAATEAPAEVAGSEFLGQAVQNLYGLVQVRSKEDEADVALGLLGDADTALRAGDIATAIEQVEAAVATPDGVDPDLAADWLADARARLTAVEAQVQLDAHIRELLTATVN